MTTVLEIALVLLAFSLALGAVAWVLSQGLGTLVREMSSLTGQILNPPPPPEAPPQQTAGSTEMFTPPWENWDPVPPPLARPGDTQGEEEPTPRPPEG